MFNQYVTDEEASEIRHCKHQIEWANEKLAEPNVMYPSGRYSHDCAQDVLFEVQDKLLDLPVFDANGTINLSLY